MKIVEADLNGVLVLVPSGAIDTTNAKLFAQRSVDSINARQCNVVIDFQNVKYLSSSGLRSLLIIRRATDAAQRKLILCGMDAEVRRVFDIANFDDHFVTCTSREEAAAHAA
jgi:anti-sigma B factor antagonist/stage II sporulation protein AA (anti-sigma F factor antagonist)